jgi:hypothetical protein
MMADVGGRGLWWQRPLPGSQDRPITGRHGSGAVDANYI